MGFRVTSWRIPGTTARAFRRGLSVPLGLGFRGFIDWPWTKRRARRRPAPPRRRP